MFAELIESSNKDDFQEKLNEYLYKDVELEGCKVIDIKYQHTHVVSNGESCETYTALILHT